MIYDDPLYWSSFYAVYGQRYREYLGRAGMKVIEDATTEQLSVADVAGHLRLDAVGSPPAYTEEAWLEAVIPAAREVCETLSGLTLAPKALAIGLSAFPCHWGWGWSRHGISLLTAPVLGLGTVSYDDGSGTPVVLDASEYVLDDFIRPAMLYPAYNTSWPSGAIQNPNSVQIAFNAGYTTPDDSPNDQPIPKSIRHAMLLVIGHLYENREQTSAIKMEEIPVGISTMLAGYRVRLGMA